MILRAIPDPIRKVILMTVLNNGHIVLTKPRDLIFFGIFIIKEKK